MPRLLSPEKTNNKCHLCVSRLPDEDFLWPGASETPLMANVEVIVFSLVQKCYGKCL